MVTRLDKECSRLKNLASERMDNYGQVAKNQHDD